MARSEARVQFGIWRGLEDLGPHAKLLYVVLLTEPTVNHAGVGAVRLALWARNASLTMGETQKALAELIDSGHVFVDEETEELFVRTMIRNDGVWKQPYVLKGALQEALLTTSQTLRTALASELQKLPPRQPDGVSKAGRPVVYPDPHATAKVLDPTGAPCPPPKASVDPSETLSEGSQGGPKTLGGRGGGRGRGEVSVGSNSTSVGPRSRGTRIPPDFAVAPEMVAWAKDRTPDVNGKLETERFINHFESAPGSKGVKLDWVKTWKNWMLEEQKRSDAHRSSRLRSVPGGGRASWLPAHYDDDGVIRDPKTGVAIER